MKESPIDLTGVDDGICPKSKTQQNIPRDRPTGGGADISSSPFLKNSFNTEKPGCSIRFLAFM